MASGAQQQQSTMEETLATSRLATRPSTRTADQTLPGGGPHPVVRWVTRLTEFLRTSTSGGAGGFENVESAGFLQASPTDLAMTPARLGILGEDSAMMLGHQTQAMITFSPPEELPQRSGLVVPTSWTQERGPQGEPLFTRDQIRRADELQAQAPLLFPNTATPVVVPPSSAGSSTHSSLVRAEIQRQLETYDSRQRVEIQRLQQEIFSLRAEREALRQYGDARNALLDGRSGSNVQGVTSLASSIGQTVAKAVRPLLPAGLLHSTEPEGSGNLVSRHLASAAPAPVASHQLPGRGGIPPAPPLLPVPNNVSHQLPGHGGVPQAPPLLPVPKDVSHQLPEHYQSPIMSLISYLDMVEYHKHPATTSPQLCLSSATWTWWSTTSTPLLPVSKDVSHQLLGHGGVPQAPPLLPVPKDVSHQLPEHAGVPQAPPIQPGVTDVSQQLPEQRAVPSAIPPPQPKRPPIQYGPRVGSSLMSAEQQSSSLTSALASQHCAQHPAEGIQGGQPPTPQQWLSGAQGVGGQGDPLTLLVGGMNQLQAALMKQMDGDQSPEAVKPGTTTLPLLKAVNPQTSPIDVQDWLELMAAPMSDLSNTSSAWWSKVRELAASTYKRWTQASPIERLTIQPPFSRELEEGHYARVNARAASMIMTALDSTVSGELVARRLTQSTPALLFRIMTLYQPGGEFERGWVLKQLQSPEPATDAVKALETLRSWSRWSRRSEDLGLARPDPTILARGLTTIVQPVLEKDYAG